MTDESRFRAPRAHGFPQQQAAGGRIRRTEDPLAELARLIGQEDPFADFVAQRPADARTPAPSSNIGAQRRPSVNDGRSNESRPFVDRNAERRRPSAPLPEPVEDDPEEPSLDFGKALRGSGNGAYAYGGSRTARANVAPPAQAPARSFREERAPTGRAEQPRVDRADYERRRTVAYDERAVAYDEDDGELYDAHDDPHALHRHAAPLEDQYDQYPPADYDPEYADDAYIPAHGEEFYDEVPPRRLKPWMMVAFAAIAAVVVGASGLFAYRAVFGVNTANTPPKTIRADAGPTKMVPGETKTADKNSNKQIYDRVGGESTTSGERIVSREERPIDPDRIPQGSPSQRTPAGTVTAAPQIIPGPSQPNPTMTAPAPALSTEPRRVRTVTVRADGTVVSDPGRTGTTGSTPEVSNEPMALQGGQQPTGSSPSALPPPRPSSQSDNPWAAQNQQAALPPQAQPGPAPRSTPAPAVAVNTPQPAGSYVVQVAAQKSEAEAQASWQSLQQRYGSVLSGQQATIRRVDLGERGIFYRAQVGPFSTRAQASEVCQSLKAAGGECVIQRN